MNTTPAWPIVQVLCQRMMEKRSIRHPDQSSIIAVGMFAKTWRKVAVVFTKQGTACEAELHKACGFFSQCKSHHWYGYLLRKSYTQVRWCNCLEVCHWWYLQIVVQDNQNYSMGGGGCHCWKHCSTTRTHAQSLLVWCAKSLSPVIYITNNDFAERIISYHHPQKLQCPCVLEVHTKAEVVHLTPRPLGLGVLFNCHA